MQASMRNTIGCIGKCTSGLNREELDYITDNINKTLAHPRGKQIFKKYLEQRRLTDNLECLALHETCCDFIAADLQQSKKEFRLESLKENVTIVKEIAEDLDVPEIDMGLMECFNEALNSDSKVALVAVLEKTRDCTRDHLRRVHNDFKRYTSEPCPMNK